MRSNIRLAWLPGVVAVLAVLVVPAARAADGPSDQWASPAMCGAADTPETGIQGDVPRGDQESGRAEQGYNCGLAVIGHNDLGGARSSDLAWSGDCAFVQGAGGLMVIDVHQSTAPVVVGAIATGGGSENIHAVRTRDRALLVVGRPRQSAPSGVPVDVFDVRTCTNPQLLGTILFPGSATDSSGPAHNIELSPDGTKVYGTIPLQEADISNLADPSTWLVRDLQCEVLEQFHPAYQDPSALCDADRGSPHELSHEVGFNKTGTRLYIGSQQAAPYEDLLHILDMSTGSPRVVASLPGAGHGLRRATIDGKEFLLHSDETAPGIPQPAERRSSGCLPEPATPYAGAAEAYLTDISTDTAPKTVSKLELNINRAVPELCAAAADSSVNSTVHYHEVDDPDRTTFGMLSMKNAGLRIFDVRNPQTPTEVAYFNPGQFRATDGSTVLDRARMHSFYDIARGHIWLLTESGGFWVLELEPQVRSALGLPPKSSLYPDGREARPGGAPNSAALVQASSTTATDLRYYCGI